MIVQSWLINNCFIRLGDKVWRQKTGIPMGFSCSPIWCNLYFMAYEFRFISRLLKLRRFDLLKLFEHAYRYIDDICILNTPDVDIFLDPKQDRTPDNPWWIYPLNIVEIKSEMTSTIPGYPEWGTDAHFLSIHIMMTDTELGAFNIEMYDKSEELR